MRKYVVPAVSFLLCFAFFCSPLIVSAAPAFSFNSIKWSVYNNLDNLLFESYGSEISQSRDDYTNRVRVRCVFNLPPEQTDTVVSFRLAGLYYDDSYGQGFFRPVSVSASVWNAGVEVQQLSVNSDTSNFGSGEIWYQLDCSTLLGSTVEVVFFLENESILAESTLLISAFANGLDSAKPDGWLSRIWNAIKDGFSSVGSWISAQTAAIGNFFSTNFNALRGWISDQTAALSGKLQGIIDALKAGKEEADQSGQELENAGNALNDSMDKINSVARPDPGSIKWDAPVMMPQPAFLSAFLKSKMFGRMISFVFMLALGSYLLFGKKG